MPSALLLGEYVDRWGVARMESTVNVCCLTTGESMLELVSRDEEHPFLHCVPSYIYKID